MTRLEHRQSVTRNLHARNSRRKVSIQRQIVKRNRDLLRRAHLREHANKNEIEKFHR
jgi:hypothetical protein